MYFIGILCFTTNLALLLLVTFVNKVRNLLNLFYISVMQLHFMEILLIQVMIMTMA